MEELKSEFLDIVILDVNSFNNFPKTIDQILKIKGNSYILLSIEKGDKFSKTDALLKGIDDYIYNDYKLEEISAKVKAIVRTLTKKMNDNNSEELSIYDLTLNPANREVKRDGKEI